MNKIALAAAAVLTAGTFGLAAIAQDSSSDFQNADGNKDGMISWEEALVVHSNVTEDFFKQADANGDGSLDEGEFQSLQTLVGALGDDGSGDSSSAATSATSTSVDNTSVGPSSSQP